MDEERNSLIRELARRHEDYQQGISRLCGEVMDNVDAVHVMMQMMQQKANNNTSQNNKNSDYDSDFHDQQQQQQQRRQEAAASATLSAGAAAVAAAAAAAGIPVATSRPKRDEMLALKKTQASAMNLSGANSSVDNSNDGPSPFFSLQLFEEPIVAADDFKTAATAASSGAKKRVTARAAFDSRICAVDSVPHRDICSWSVREARSGKSICSLRLKLESATLSFLG